MGGGMYCLVNASLRGGRGRPQRETLNGKAGSSLAGRSNRNWGPLSDHGLSSGPTFGLHTVHQFHSGHSLFSLASSPVRRFLHRHHPPAAQREKNPCIRRTLGSALDSRSGRPNGKLLNGNVGSSLAGRSNRNWGALPDDGWAPGRRHRCTLCTNFIRAHSLFTLASSPDRRFLHRHHRPAAQREKNPCTRRISLRPLFSPVRTCPPMTVEKFHCIAAVERPTKNVVTNPAHTGTQMHWELSKGGMVRSPSTSTLNPP